MRKATVPMLSLTQGAAGGKTIHPSNAGPPGQIHQLSVRSAAVQPGQRIV